MAQNKTRILFIPNTLETFGGGERWTLEVATELKKIFNVSILNPISKNAIIRRDKENISREYDLDKIEIADIQCAGVKSVAFGTEQFIFMMPYPKDVLKMQKKIKEADTVYLLSFNPMILFYSILFCKRYKKRLILGIHNPTFFKLFDKDVGAGQKMLNFIYKMLIGNIKYFHVINGRDERLIKAHYKKATVYSIPNFVKSPNKKLAVNKKEFIVLFVGRLDKNQKGIDLLYKTIESVLEATDNVVFHIVGSGGDGEYLITGLARKYPRHVKKLGFLDSSDLEDEYIKASLFVLPSRFESFGLSLIEAQSYGLPAVAFDVEIIKGILKEKYQGELARPFDQYQFSHGIIRYMELWKENKMNLDLKRKIANQIKLRYNKNKIMMQFVNILNYRSS